MRSSNIWICVILTFCQFFKRIFFFLISHRESLPRDSVNLCSQSQRDQSIHNQILVWQWLCCDGYFFTFSTKQCSTKLDLTLTHLWELHCNALYQAWPPVTMVMRARQGVMCADRILLHLRNRISCNSYCVVSLECAELCEAEKSAMKSRFPSVCGQLTYSTKVNRQAWSLCPSSSQS